MPYKILKKLFLLTLLIKSTLSFALSNRDDYDADDNGLIEIYDLADLDEIRNNLNGHSLYGSSIGCPAPSCIGFELVNDLLILTQTKWHLRYPR